MINPQTKGKAYERYIAHKLSKACDCNVRRTPCSGGLDIKGDLRNLSGPLEGFVFELKKQEKLNIWKALQQTQDEAGNKVGVLIFARNRSKDFACLLLDDFLELIMLKEKLSDLKGE